MAGRGPGNAHDFRKGHAKKEMYKKTRKLKFDFRGYHDNKECYCKI